MCLRSACHTCGQTLALAEEVRGQHCLHRRHHSCADCPCSTLVAPSEFCMICCEELRSPLHVDGRCFEGQGRWFCRGCIESWLVCAGSCPACRQPLSRRSWDSMVLRPEYPSLVLALIREIARPISRPPAALLRETEQNQVEQLTRAVA